MNDGLDLGIPVGMDILHSGRIRQVQVLGRGLSPSSVRSGFRPERKKEWKGTGAQGHICTLSWPHFLALPVPPLCWLRLGSPGLSTGRAWLYFSVQ